MRVIVAFDDLIGDAASDLGNAFWLADSPSNRKLAQAAWASKQYDANSAVFQPPSHAVQPADVIERLDDVDLHQPNWREIEFSGVDWTPALQAALGGRYAGIVRKRTGIAIMR